MHFIRGVVTDYVLRAHVANDLMRDVRQFGQWLRVESAATGFCRHSVQERDRFVFCAFPHEPAVGVEFIHKSDHENLHVCLTQTLGQLCFGVITLAILAVSNHNQRAAAAVVVFSFLILRNVFCGQVNAIDYRRLSASHVEVVDTFEQWVSVRREVLHSLNLFAIDELFEESFVASLVTVDDCFGRIKHIGKLSSKRLRSIDGESIDNRYFFLRERKNRLTHTIFVNDEFIFVDIINGPVVTIDDAYI